MDPSIFSSKCEFSNAITNVDLKIKDFFQLARIIWNVNINKIVKTTPISLITAANDTCTALPT